MREQLLGEHLEQWLALDRRDGVFALGAIVPQPRPLPAGDEERADFAALEQRVTVALGVLVELRLVGSGNARVGFDGPDVRWQGQRRLRPHL